ncbi:site-2 protease family protein [Pyrobaculum aerophilum]|uniref:Peptidase M50 n=1 Tax=Pyrobaculum aerophilum TaxID=13773 RepID=A0A371QXZ8_9CREN|nr:site-2 protease family protein [Pyrobaculum aerophilum]RFA94474.1 peptidase M50 [Pyrobaculum aerophilum]RFA95481.1 peptidase M50 [Pyrobaculum aerophilum]
MYEERRQELIDMAISLLVLTLGFSIALSGDMARGLNWARVLSLMPYVAFVLLFAFIGHELAHREVAKRLGYFAMYKADYYLLPLAIIFPLLFGFVFAAPGSVVVSPYRLYRQGDEKRDMFFIAAAGPLANIAFAILGLALLTATQSYFWHFFAYINAWLALFNLLPLPPLDGNKVIRSNPVMWVLIFAIAAVLVWRLW